MDIYLHVAEMSVNLFAVLGLGGAIGFLSGLFGVGGGFLMTPMLIFMGVPPAVAVGTQSAQILASSVSGVLANLRRRAVDLKMGWVLVAGGVVGSVVGVALASAAILYTTSNIIHYYRPDQHVAAALELFAAVALLFFYILKLLMMSRSNN